MDSTDYDNGGSGGGPIDTIVISLGILSLLLLICIASYLYNRRSRIRRTRSDQQPAVTAALFAWNRRPSAKASLYPKLLFSDVKKTGCDTTTTCSICLGDYGETDMVRLLTQCGHVFHVECIDTWLLLHPTCPVCRSSPTPVAEVAPLATAVVSPV